ncbi:MAG: hypothetical protein K2X04_00920 [Burkholderiales bacterium]|nr:hypothetical protein [Burkholderiales bacterium]
MENIQYFKINNRIKLVELKIKALKKALKEAKQALKEDRYEHANWAMINEANQMPLN